MTFFFKESARFQPVWHVVVDECLQTSAYEKGKHNHKITDRRHTDHQSNRRRFDDGFKASVQRISRHLDLGSRDIEAL